jgi:uncharacterized protein YqiB (DUF1249 family)
MMSSSTRLRRRDLPLRRHPIDLSTAMAVCDANYLRILKLLPDLGVDSQRRIGLPGTDTAAASVVELRVLENFRYTSTLQLSMRDVQAGATNENESAHPYYRPPVMLVRLYHDAATAEVVSYQDRSTAGFSMLLTDSVEFKPDEKEQVNQFLAEWLKLCLDLGLGERPTPPRQAAEGVV